MRSNQAMIRDQSCLNPIGIESKTQGDRDELKIMLQNRLISSRYNQELREEDSTSIFIRDFREKNANRSIR